VIWVLLANLEYQSLDMTWLATWPLVLVLAVAMWMITFGLVMLIANLVFSSAVAVRRLCDNFFSRRAMMWPRNP